MFCMQCGKEIPTGSKFCGNCGKPIPTPGSTVSASPQIVQEPGSLLTQLKSVSKYKGTPVAGYSESTGILSIYNNRLEFKKKSGSALWGRGGAIGLGISAGLAKSEPIETFELEQISELHKGKYMGIYNTLVITLKNSEVWSFCPVLPGSSEPQKIISLLKPFM